MSLLNSRFLGEVNLINSSLRERERESYPVSLLDDESWILDRDYETWADEAESLIQPLPDQETMYALNNESMYPDMVTSSYSFYVYTTALNLYQINPITVCLKADTSRLDYDGGISSTSGTNLALTIASATDNSITNEAIVFELDMSAPQPAKVYKKYVKITFPEGTTDYTIYFGCVSPIISFNNGTEDIKAFMQYYMSVSNTINSHTADMTFEIKA